MSALDLAFNVLFEIGHLDNGQLSTVTVRGDD